MNKEIIIFINIVHFILTIEQLTAVFNVDMNNVLITHILSTHLNAYAGVRLCAIRGDPLISSKKPLR